MISFKEFVKEKIDYFISHLKNKSVLMNYHGDLMHEINLSFYYLSDLYLEYADEAGIRNSQQFGNEDMPNINIGLPVGQMPPLDIAPPQLGMGLGMPNIGLPATDNFGGGLSSLSGENIKITDSDLKPLLQEVNESYNVSFNVQGQDISDQTVLFLSELYSSGKCTFRRLKLAGNEKLTKIGICKLGQSLHQNTNIREINLHGLQIGTSGINRIIELIGITGLAELDLGLIGNQSLKYLSETLLNTHKIESLAFGESSADPWKNAKKTFQDVIRKSVRAKQIISVNLYPTDVAEHYDLISELGILCRKHRNLKVSERENEFKAASLNPKHNKYYDPDNHSLNAYKFSVKSYLNNVFGSLLDEALYFLEKERRNSLREQAIFTVTKQPINKMILQDICTADGSILVLTKYLLAKIKDKKQRQ